MPRLLDRWILLVDGALIALFLVGYAGAYVDPRWFWTPALVATALPFFSALLVPVFVCALVRRRPRLAVSYLVLLLAAGLRFAPPDLSRHAAPSDQDLVVMTYNVPVSKLDAGRGSRARQRTAMQSVIRSTSPHLVGFQEVAIWTVGVEQQVVYPWHVAMLPDWGYGEYRAPREAEPLPASDEGYGMERPVFSALPVQSQEKRQIGRAGREPGYVVRTRFRWQGRIAIHYNVHLHSFARPRMAGGRWWHPTYWRQWLSSCRRAYRQRAEEAVHLRRIVEAETEPVIVSGDFNSTPHHWTYRHLARGFTDAFAVGGSGWGGTWPSVVPLLRIDYVLASPEWTVTSASVMPLTLSDHRPLVARLRWRGAGSDAQKRGEDAR